MATTLKKVMDHIEDLAQRELGHSLREADNGTVLELGHGFALAAVGNLSEQDAKQLLADELTENILREHGILKED